MNNRRREKLKTAKAHLSNASNIISGVLDEEQNCYDNVPENLQYGDRYDNMEAAIENLEEALNSIEEAEDSIEGAMA